MAKKPDQYIQIQQPIWHNKSVGIAIDPKLDPDALIEIEIVYVGKKSGKRAFPNKYQMDVAEILIAATGTVKKGQNTLYIVPISKLKEVDVTAKNV